MALTLQQAAQNYTGGARTFKAGDGSTQRTSGYTDYLRRLNLLPLAGGIGPAPAPNTPPPVPVGGSRPATTVPPLNLSPTLLTSTKPGYDPVAPVQLGQPIAPPAPIAATPVAPAPVTPPRPMAPSWIQHLFPAVGAGGLSTTGIGAIQSWNPNFQPQIDEWKAASAVDANYASAYSAALMDAMQRLQPLQSEVAGLLARDPVTGLTRYQDLQRRADADNARSISRVYGNTAARGLVGGGGARNANLARQAEAYLPVVQELQQKFGDARLAAIGQQVGSNLLGLNMGLVNAYQQAVGNAYSNLPAIPAYVGSAA